MASSWQTVADQMNLMFLPGGNLADTGTKFRKKHGHDGKGSDAGTKAYRFGEFAVDAPDSRGRRAVTPEQEAKWLIDSGTRHFDQNSLVKLEDAIRDSLTRAAGSELPISFTIDPNLLPAGSLATADVVQTKDNNGVVTGYTVTIHCAP
jgi:hypothetical protein